MNPKPVRNEDAANDAPASTDRPTHGSARRWGRRVRRLGVWLLVGMLLYTLAACTMQRSMLFPRHLVTVSAHATAPADGERWQLDTSAGPVEAWFLPAPGATADHPGPAVIFAHGNGEAIDHWPDMLRTYRELGVSVLLPEYRGYGRSAGSPSERAILADLEAFHDRLIARPDVDATRIIFHGRSLGGAALATFTTRRTPAALIVQSAFNSVADMARQFGVPRFLLMDRFEALRAVEQYPGPLLILHGRHDSIIPLAHAQRFHVAAPQSELILYPNDHNDPMPQPAYWQDIERFLKEAGLLN